MIQKLKEKFLESQRPLVFVGNGIKSSGLKEELADFCIKFQTPCLLTSHAMGALPTDFPFLMGVYGLASKAEVSQRIVEYKPDLLIILGSKLGEVSTRGWNSILNDVPYKIHVDKNPAVFKKTYQTDFELELDLKDFFSMFQELPSESVSNSNLLRIIDEIPLTHSFYQNSSEGLHPGAVVQVINELALNNTIFYSDIGACMAWSLKELLVKETQDFFVPIGLGAMGSGVAGSIGAKLANPNRPVVCLTGDASFLMHGNEIFTLSQLRKNIVYFIFNDGGHGLVYHGMRTLGFNPGSVRFEPQPNFARLAEAMGALGLTVSSIEELASLDMSSLHNHPTAVVVDVKIDARVEAPIMERNRILGFDENKRMK